MPLNPLESQQSLLIFGVWVGFEVSKRFTFVLTKFAIGSLVVALTVLLPFGDEIFGAIYLRYLCATKAGVKVYQEIRLPPEYWDAASKPKFYDERNGNFHLTKEFPTDWKIERFSPLLHIDRRMAALRSRDGKQTYAEGISFMHWGGWVRRNFSPHNSAASCGNDLNQSRAFVRQVFKPAGSK